MHRTYLAAVVPLIVISLTVGISKALAFGSFDDLLDLVTEQFQDLEKHVDDFISEEFEEAAPYVQAVVDEATGALGIPDLADIETSIADILEEEAGGLLDLDPENQTIDITNEIDRQTLLARAASLLSEEGQQTLSETFQQVANTIEDIDGHADAALNAISTQQAIKEIAQQNARQGELLGAVEMELLNSRVDSQLGNITMGNISETLDQERRYRLGQQKANTWALQQAAVMAELY